MANKLATKMHNLRHTTYVDQLNCHSNVLPVCNLQFSPKKISLQTLLCVSVHISVSHWSTTAVVVHKRSIIPTSYSAFIMFMFAFIFLYIRKIFKHSFPFSWNIQFHSFISIDRRLNNSSYVYFHSLPLCPPQIQSFAFPFFSSVCTMRSVLAIPCIGCAKAL